MKKNFGLLFLFLAVVIVPVLCQAEEVGTNTGNLKVIILPSQAVGNGVKWSIRELPKAGSFYSGISLGGLDEGIYTVHFEGAEGWSVPMDKRVEVYRGGTTTLTEECNRDPIGNDPILSKEYCVGFTRNFYVFDISEMPQEEVPPNEIDDWGYQIGNAVFNVFKDIASPTSILAALATGGLATGVNTWVNSTINVMQILGLTQQTQFVLLNDKGNRFGFDSTVKLGDPFIPVIFLKTQVGGASHEIMLHIYSNYERNLILPDTYDKKLTLQTNNIGNVKPNHLYMLIPRTTFLTKKNNEWSFAQDSRGMEGLFLNTEGEYTLQLIAFPNTYGLSEYDILIPPDDTQNPISTVTLTRSSPAQTITSGSDVQVFGTAVSNQITLESGAKAELLNFPGFNTVRIQSNSDVFQVSRSGTVVTFDGPDGTRLKIPATTSVQTITFTDKAPLTLSIYQGQVMLDDQEITSTPASIIGNQDEPGSCGAYIAPGEWREFDCYNLAAIGKTTNDDPFTPSWRLIGGYWQWGRKGPDPSQWYNTNTSNFAHGPTGPGSNETNKDSISGWVWYQTRARNGAWSDSTKTPNDPCPVGFRVPTRNQWDGVRSNNIQSTVGSWSSSATNYSSARKFGDDLMLPAAGSRLTQGGSLNYRGYRGKYWSSSEFPSNFRRARHLEIRSEYASTYDDDRLIGFSVRCISE